MIDEKTDKNKLKKLIINKGCFSKQENTWIYEQNFRQAAKYLYHNLRKYHLDKKRVLDVGCGYGSNLVHFGKGSLGLDINPKHTRFLKSIGLNYKRINFEEKIEVGKKSFEIIWCSNVLEHMIAPHYLLLQLRRLLVNKGFLFIYIPLLTPLQMLKPFRDYLASEHINFYTRQTAIYTLERSGFKVIQVNFAFTYNIFINDLLSPLLKLLSPGLTFICKKNIHFKNPSKRIPEFNPRWMKT